MRRYRDASPLEGLTLRTFYVQFDKRYLAIEWLIINGNGFDVRAIGRPGMIFRILDPGFVGPDSGRVDEVEPGPMRPEPIGVAGHVPVF
jgi:hypothetical protein